MTTLMEVIRGLEVFAKYNGELAVEHDMVLAGDTSMPLTPVDLAILQDNGWHIDKQTGSYYKFV